MARNSPPDALESSFWIGAMRRYRRGFTIVELLITIVIGGILTQIAFKGFGEIWSQVAAREARNVFQGLMARTRAQAIEGGVPTFLLADPGDDSVMILANGGVVENVRFMEEMGVDIQGPAGITRVCMTPRGYANPSCNSFKSPVTITLVRGAKSETIEILPLGQMRW
jgi:prepilin-type N-terminal cleavage/methylation domain-containing protein